jgi:outer membrane lipoprotein carrier protein
MRLNTFCLTLAIIVATQVTQAQGIQTLRGFMAQHPAVAGDFVQITQGKAGQQTGSFALAKPGQFRWVLKKPFEQLIVSDGKTLTQWDADLNQATVRSAAGLLANTPVALLLGGMDADKFFTLTEMGKDANSDAALVWVQATPKNAESQFKLIKLAFKDGLPSVMQIQDAFGGVSQLLFKNISTVPIPAAQFGFTLPKGADVVKL